jgi:hypothetical protein
VWRRREAETTAPEDLETEIADLGGEAEPEPEAPSSPPPVILPFARRDLERLRLMVLAQRRLTDVDASASARQALASKSYFEEALRWMEIHGGPDGRDLASRWRKVRPKVEPAAAASEPGPAGRKKSPPRKRRRRRRRRNGGSSTARA